MLPSSQTPIATLRPRSLDATPPVIVLHCALPHQFSLALLLFLLQFSLHLPILQFRGFSTSLAIESGPPTPTPSPFLTKHHRKSSLNPSFSFMFV
jgi:hypothetical protein